jgi:hypothetical protein
MKDIEEKVLGVAFETKMFVSEFLFSAKVGSIPFNFILNCDDTEYHHIYLCLP